MAYTKENFKKDTFILQMLVSRDFKLKYRRSFLGILWSILNPLLMMIVMSVVFSFIFRFSIENYALYLILGMTLFNLMAVSTNAGVMSIINAAPLIKKIRVNKLVFPLETVVFELVNYALSLVAVALVIAYQLISGESIPLTLNIFFLPLLLFYMLMFCAGLSLLLSALAVFFRDIIYLWGVVILAWTYATPLFYSVNDLAPWVKDVMNFNPMYHFVNYIREIVLWGTTPSLTENFICFAVAIASLALGLFVFRKTEKRFILHV